jgi:4-aminobutyrate aminotransferase
MKDRGYIIGKNGMNREVLAFQPPLIIEESDIDELCSALDAVLKEVQG